MAGPGSARVVVRVTRLEALQFGGTAAEDPVGGGETAGYQSNTAFDDGPVDTPGDEDVSIGALFELDRCRLKVGYHSDDGGNDGAFGGSASPSIAPGGIFTYKAPKPKAPMIPSLCVVVICKRQIYSTGGQQVYRTVRLLGYPDRLTHGIGRRITIMSTTTSEIPYALCNITVSTQDSFSITSVVQYAAGWPGQMKRKLKKYPSPHIRMIHRTTPLVYPKTFS